MFLQFTLQLSNGAHDALSALKSQMGLVRSLGNVAFGVLVDKNRLGNGRTIDKVVDLSTVYPSKTWIADRMKKI